jgi:hypothetical protein
MHRLVQRAPWRRNRWCSNGPVRGRMLGSRLVSEFLAVGE